MHKKTWRVKEDSSSQLLIHSQHIHILKRRKTLNIELYTELSTLSTCFLLFIMWNWHE